MKQYRRLAAVSLAVAVIILSQGHYLMTMRYPSTRPLYPQNNTMDTDVKGSTTETFQHIIPPSQRQLERRARRHNQMKDTRRWQNAIDKYFVKHREVCKKWEKINHHPSMPYCPCIPSHLAGYKDVMFRVKDLSQISADNPQVKPGGHWAPSNCSSRFSLAIIIPFRDRETHLAILLAQLHPFLQQQLANYTIYVVEQKSPETFNKAIMMNTGYKYANRTQSPDCVIFHDVDTIPEDDRHFYTCLPDRVLHIGYHLDLNNYNIAYPTMFGGATSYTRHQFERVNGFSNIFFGWGGEDDDMGGRVNRARLGKAHDPMEVAGYSVVPHTRDPGNERPENYWSKHKKVPFSRDGLNTLQVTIAAVEKRPLYTWLHVDVHHKVMGR